MCFEMKGSIAENPLAVRNVQDAGDELLCPVATGESQGRACKRFALEFEKCR